LPPLRDRKEDIPLLAAHHLAQMARRYRKPVTGFDPNAMQLLTDHYWQGNVRELNHVLERAVLMAQDHLIHAGDLALRPVREGQSRMEDMSLEEVEAFLIKKALSRHAGNVSHAASALGLSRSALYRRIQRYSI
jgi:DNA-binding NtrC family response regulator